MKRPGLGGDKESVYGTRDPRPAQGIYLPVALVAAWTGCVFKEIGGTAVRPQRADIILEPLLFEKGVHNLGSSEGVVTAGIKGIEQGAVPVLIRLTPVRQFFVAYAVR